MARPKVPLISKRTALATALRIIDTEGIEALSIRRLASEMNVNGASFYHHFKNKDEIVFGAAELALDGARVPADLGEDWREWIIRNAAFYRDALLAHPDLIPVLLRRGRLGIGFRRLEATVVRLQEQGVPIEAIAPLLEALEAFATGHALSESWAGAEQDGLDPLALERTLTPGEEFDLGCRVIIDGIAALYDVPPAVAARPGRLRSVDVSG